MIARSLRVLVALVMLAVTVGTFGVFGPPAGAQDAADSNVPETPGGDGAIDDLVGCVQASKRLLVLVAIDESASLKNSDPENRRVDAAQSALDGLIALSQAEGEASPDVQVALGAFSNDYRVVQDWTPVNAETAEELRGAVDSFAELNDGIDTDFVNALTAGRESLADQAATVTAAGGAAPCRAILLFTDGGYDLAVRTPATEEKLGITKPYAPGIELTDKESVAKAEQRGRAALCKPGGLADSLRNDDIALLTVALARGVTRRAQVPLAAATEGQADDYTCGTKTEKPSGSYLSANDVDVLVTRFNEIGTRLAGGNLLPGSDQVTICGNEICEKGTRSVELDPSLRRAQILALAPKPGAVLSVAGPGGATAKITGEKDVSIGGVPARTRVIAGRGFVVDLERPTDLKDWNGTWKVTIQDPTGKQAGDPATLQIFVFSDIGIALGESDPLVRGESSKLRAELVVPKGIEAGDVVAAATVEARIRDLVTGKVQVVPLEGPPVGPYEGTVETSAETTSNAVSVVVEARLTTTSAAALVSQSPVAERPVLRPDGEIQMLPGSLQLPALTGSGTTEGEMQVVGGKSKGCVWFGKVVVPEPPEGAGTIEFTVDDEPLPGRGDCIAVDKNGRVSVFLQASPTGRASGTARGYIEVYEQIQGAEKPTVTQVPFRFDLARGIDETQRLVLSIVLMLAGIGLPLLVLMIVNARTARFQALDAVRGTALPVLVSGDTMSRTDGPYPRSLSFKPGDFDSLRNTGNDKRFTFGGVVFRARASRNPFGATVALAAPEGGAEKLKGNVGSRVELDPSLAGSWVFLLDSDKTRLGQRGDAEGLLIAFVAEGEFKPQTERMMPDIAERLPSTAARLAGLVRSVKRKPSKRHKHDAEADPSDQTEAGDELIGAEDPDPDAMWVDDASGDGSGDGVTPPAGEPETEPQPEPEPEAESVAETGDGPTDAPAAPAGFSGTANVDPAPAAPPPPDDDGPDGPPVGFSGGRPS